MTTWNGLRRSPIGVKKRAMVQTELNSYPAFEALLALHKLDYWHNTISYASLSSGYKLSTVAGWPDYTIFGDGWHAWVELKARSPVTNRRGKVSLEQRRYQTSIERSGGEWVSFCLPDDYPELDAWLNARTGHDIHSDGRLR